MSAFTKKQCKFGVWFFRISFFNYEGDEISILCSTKQKSFETGEKTWRNSYYILHHCVLRKKKTIKIAKPLLHGIHSFLTPPAVLTLTLYNKTWGNAYVHRFLEKNINKYHSFFYFYINNGVHSVKRDWNCVHMVWIGGDWMDTVFWQNLALLIVIFLPSCKQMVMVPDRCFPCGW